MGFKCCRSCLIQPLLTARARMLTNTTNIIPTLLLERIIIHTLFLGISHQGGFMPGEYEISVMNSNMYDDTIQSS
jgi:hypothetical protein